MPIKFTKEIYNKFKREAEKLDMPITQFLNMLVNEWIEKRK